MSTTGQSGTRRLEHWVHWTLLSGLVVSAAFLIAGLIAAHARPEGAGPERPASILAILRGTVRSDASTLLLELGLVVLMATPVLRVVALAVGWTLTREYRFALVAVVVLALLGLSVGLGFR